MSTLRPILSRYGVLALLAAGLILVFAGRTALAVRFEVPRSNDILVLVAAAGSLAVLLVRHRGLKATDYIVAAGAGLLVGITMCFATLFTPYDFLGLISGNLGQALVRGLLTALVMLGGMASMRQNGPVQVRLVGGASRPVFGSLALGLAIGAPLAILNVIALQFTQGHPVIWQNPLAALADALQPAVVEEAVYRFALLGLVWWVLRPSMQGQAAWGAGILTLLAHNFMHFDDLWLTAPWMAAGMGVVLALLWGLPPTLLALRRDLESAIAFHWVQDAARFWAGF